MQRSYFLIAIPALLSIQQAAVAQRPFSAADTLALQTIGEVAPSPNGKTIAFSVSTIDLPANKTISRLMRISATGGSPEVLAGAPEGASSIRWAPNGERLAFIAPHEKTTAIYTLAIASGKVARVCDYHRSNSFLPHAGNMLAWSPDGKQIAFAGTVEPDPPLQDPLVVTRILYKTRTSFSDNRRTHVFVVPANGGEPRALTSGNHDEHSIDWGGVGTQIVFLSNHEGDPDALLNYDIFAVDVASGAVRQITHTPGVEMEPRISPDGYSIAYTATKRKITTIDSVAEDAHAWVVPITGGTGKEVNASLDRRTSAIAWSPDGKSILYTVGDHGSVLGCTTFLNTNETTCPIGKGAQIGAFSPSRDGPLAFTLSKPDMPAEIFRLEASSREPRQLTHLNSQFIAAHQISIPEEIHFKSVDGANVQGWLYPALNVSGRTPMILTIHGGPHGQFGYAFNAATQFYAGRGGSYGGFMTNWVITQTNRFKAAVSAASVSDLISFYATSMYQDLVHAEFRGFPWADDNYTLLWKWSPLAHVKNATTPTIFLHGENDNDVHITQAEQMFTALRQRGIESELVRYPREGHGFREPKHRLDSLTRTVEWFDRFQAK
jgi:dipeptidyl aminopeptidase/acylaminoacyl peptidase